MEGGKAIASEGKRKRKRDGSSASAERKSKDRKRKPKDRKRKSSSKSKDRKRKGAASQVRRKRKPAEAASHKRRKSDADASKDLASASAQPKEKEKEKKEKVDQMLAWPGPVLKNIVAWATVPESQFKLIHASGSAHPDLGECAKKEAAPYRHYMSDPVIIDSCYSVIKGMYAHPNGSIATWGRDPLIKIWMLKGKNGALVSTNSGRIHECPQDMSWHPDGNRLFAVFKSTSQAQVGFCDFSPTDSHFELLKDNPHAVGCIRCIRFMPWEVSGSPCFATSGDDHSVVLWNETQSGWNSQKIHDCHTSSVYGVAGNVHRSLLCSASLDKHLRIIDVVKGQSHFSGKFDSSLLSVEFNPVDPNLILLTGCLNNKQLMLLDLRYLDPESLVHSFGWTTAERKPITTRLFQQSWSPDGLYVASGSASAEFNIYDIRYNGYEASQKVMGHKAPVIKVLWHPVVKNLLVSAHKAGRIWLQQVR